MTNMVQGCLNQDLATKAQSLGYSYAEALTDADVALRIDQNRPKVEYIKAQNLYQMVGSISNACLKAMAIFGMIILHLTGIGALAALLSIPVVKNINATRVKEAEAEYVYEKFVGRATAADRDEFEAIKAKYEALGEDKLYNDLISRPSAKATDDFAAIKARLEAKGKVVLAELDRQRAERLSGEPVDISAVTATAAQPKAKEVTKHSGAVISKRSPLTRVAGGVAATALALGAKFFGGNR